ncbi:MAG: hypothetical protein L6282_10450 [Candidatus Methanoperedenaceae archaeon]|nr:hypothetical protein [Candidatus Methanoperedenaceae archaeon]
MTKIVGQSKVYLNFRVSVSEIKELLKVKEGDRIVFVKETNGEIVIKKMRP